MLAFSNEQIQLMQIKMSLPWQVINQSIGNEYFKSIVALYEGHQQSHYHLVRRGYECLKFHAFYSR